jgi:diadenosine tetraphosphate (Ap4A) HIT family hydrolase
VNCSACENNARLEELPPRENVAVRGGWRVAHAFNTTLFGWLVVIPLRHVERFAELNDGEAGAFAPLVRDLSRTLHDELGCAKTYVVVLGEQRGFEHLHAHVIPRMPELDEATMGTGVFSLLDRPENEWIPEPERDELAATLRRRLERVL